MVVDQIQTGNAVDACQQPFFRGYTAQYSPVFVTDENCRHPSHRQVSVSEIGAGARQLTQAKLTKASAATGR